MQSASSQIEKYGFRKFTIDNIASDLSISKKTVYKYFTSKKTLIDAVVDYHLEILSNYVKNITNNQRSWLEKLEDIFFSYIPKYDPERLLEHMKELKLYFPEVWEKTERVKIIKREQVRKLIYTGLQNGDVSPDLNPAVAILVFERTMDAVLEEGFLTENNLTPKQAMEAVKDTLLYGILRR
ncbi:TetR/AcrR family transcriptional regulator [Pelotomaculum sp. PtaB.Bin117]|uniref:TetR/AcrR family transcriptional regulator n=1 Tax=Pelotomaculum sp. PtaB.Bin117 TaxID=1811694 RepID=UPI00257CB3B8|nr:TetR/AcrR family transcriptional regulator [Pelotomaculum sp. PtaB.Bin117]